MIEVLAISTASFPFTIPRFGLFGQSSPKQAVCGLLNRLFERQPAVFDLLAQHAGQTFRLLARPVDAAMTIGHDGRLAPADEAVVPDVTLTIDTARLWAEGWRPGQPFPERAGLVHVSGDAAMAQTLSTLAKSWRPDIEDLLSQYLGDVAAVQLVSGAKRLGALAAQFVSRTSGNLAEYAAYEANLVLPDAPLREHTKTLAQLNAQLDTLQKRLDSLDARARQLGDQHTGEAR